MKRLLQAIAMVTFLILPSAIYAQTALVNTPEYQVTHMLFRGESVVLFRGEMTLGSARSIELSLQQTQSSILVMNSPGGFMVEAYQLGFVIQELGISVLIVDGDICLSACAFAVMASENLILNGILAFHSPYVENIPSGMSTEDFGAMERGAMMRMMIYTITMGYSVGLVADIHEQTSRHEYIVFDDVADLYRFRDNGVLTYDEDMPTLYTIMTSDQIAEYVDTNN